MKYTIYVRGQMDINAQIEVEAKSLGNSDRNLGVIDRLAAAALARPAQADAGEGKA